MKKFVVIFSLFFSITVSGQKLVATASGLRDSSNIEKTFVVINVEGKTAKELYENAVKYINKAYRSADDVIKGKTEGEYLKFITTAPDFAYYKFGFGKVFIDGKYTVELTFRDGKVKYEVIELLMFKLTDGFMNNYFFKDNLMGVFNSRLKLAKPELKTSLEFYFNHEIKSLTDALNEKHKNDNW